MIRANQNDTFDWCGFFLPIQLFLPDAADPLLKRRVLTLLECASPEALSEQVHKLEVLQLFWRAS